MADTITAPDGFADLVGPVAVQEFERAADRHKPDLIEFARRLPTLTDTEFLIVAGRALAEQALKSKERTDNEEVSG